jgi:post-segregation antitoxin (ccd killing protein)
MAKSTQKLKTFRLNESSFELLERAKKNHVMISKFVREAISEKFERDFPIWIKEAELKNTESLPF